MKPHQLLSVSDGEPVSGQRKASLLLYGAILLLLLSVIILIVGIVLISQRPVKCGHKEASVTQAGKTGKLTTMDQYCAFSDEAKKIDLEKFMKKVQKAYYDHSPNQVAYHPDLTMEELNRNIKERYLPYDPRPEVLKRKTDAALALRKEIQDFKYDEAKLTPRERRVIKQMKHFLQQNFGTPYDENFYAGDWMLGPNYFCWQPVCGVSYDVNAIGYYIKPQNLSEFKLVLKMIMQHKDTVKYYIENLKLGVKAGYVRESIDCKAGKDAFIERHKVVGSTRQAAGVLQEWFVEDFLVDAYLKGLDDASNRSWMETQGGRSLRTSLELALIEGVGQPILDLINYLEKNHSVHCLPKGVSSGLGNLPVDYIYYNGIPDKTQPTTKVLPITGTPLSGKETYKTILPYFTTTDITPEEIYKKGLEQLSVFYPQAVTLVKNVTNEANETEAIKKFRILLDTQSQWHGLMKYPKNESDEKAYKTCIDDASAKKHCPVRWRNIQLWADWIRQIMSLIHPKLTDSFHFTGDKNTVPNCPVLMWPHYNPSNGAMFFQKSDAQCSKPTQFGLPFFLEKYGPKYHEWSVTGHESRPGHHTQFQGTEEHFRDSCGGLIPWIDDKGYYVNFIEGWALYSENPILAEDTDLYKENILQRLGMIKWQIFRAVRLIVDTGLHYRGENSTWALAQFDKYTWDTTDFVVKEITRYMSDPGQATAYMLGRLDILSMRKKAEVVLGDQFNIKDFHYQILSQGLSPMDYIKSYMDTWIGCVRNNNGPMCEYVLTPVKTLTGKKSSSQKFAGPPQPRQPQYI